MTDANSKQTIVHLLEYYSRQQPQEDAYIFLPDGEGLEIKRSFLQMDLGAQAVAARLQQQDLSGQRALLLLHAGFDFLYAFFGCLMSGMIAVPLQVPKTNRRSELVEQVWRNCDPKIIITNRELYDQFSKAFLKRQWFKQSEFILIDQLNMDSPVDFRARQIDPDAIAFLQYTSGSTGDPKGVMVRHRHIIDNQQMIKNAFKHSEETIFVSWLPAYHDMGLIGNLLHPFYLGVKCVFMSPSAFIQKPSRWLKAISRYGGTTSGAPNFAYDLCVDTFSREKYADVDLSTWEVAFNGAEPVNAETIRRFTTTFKPFGFKEEAFYPVYGMAEATLFISGRSRPCRLYVRKLAKDVLEGEMRAVSPPSGQPATFAVCCGHAWGEETIIIVDPNTAKRCEDGFLGEIWISGPNVADGYWDNPVATQESFKAYVKETGEGPFFRTGDIGFLSEGELYITGRLKDLIIIEGRNIYPQDIEYSASTSHSSLVFGRCAGFSVEVGGRERLAVVQEIKRSQIRNLDAEKIFQAMIGAITADHDVEAYTIALVKPGVIPMTTSGKIKRRACKSMLLDQKIPIVDQWKNLDEALRDDDGQNNRLDADAGTLEEQIHTWLTNKICEFMGVRRDDFDSELPFACMGIGSKRAMQLTGELSDKLQRRLSPTLFYEHPTIGLLARHLALCPTLERSDSTQYLQEAVPVDEIAIIGMGLRFPGGLNTPESYWRFLTKGKCAIDHLSETQWNLFNTFKDTYSPMVYRLVGGFIEGKDLFDADFFGIRAHEAESMDPQQRIALEVIWEALERANLNKDQLFQSNTGVYMGMGGSDYGDRVAALNQNQTIDAYTATGILSSMASGRISHFLGLNGPSMTIDTACSSALTAVHIACDDLRNHQCNLAIAGGVNIMISERGFLALEKMGALSQSGTCKTFDAEADGYVRGEGCGVVVLKRLKDAIDDDDMIWATILGSAVNHDGPSNGLTAPNGNAQREVIQKAILNAGISAMEVDYVEAHGTGTELGDPTEVNALLDAYRPEAGNSAPLWVGSVKTNIGHLEPAAGIASLIKVALMVNHGAIPPTLNFNALNPHIKNPEQRLRIPTATLPWRSKRPKRIAAVSSFGISGTNAHALIAAAPERELKQRKASRSRHVLTISARSNKALAEQAQVYASFLEQNIDASLEDICACTNVGRTHFSHRAAWAVGSTQTAIERLRACAEEPKAEGSHSPARSKIVFVFKDECSWDNGFGRRLYQDYRAFQEPLKYCGVLLRDKGAEAAGALLNPDKKNRPAVVDPAHLYSVRFSYEYSLCALWISWGLYPSIVIGSGVGDLVAASVAGSLSLEDALELSMDLGKLRMLERGAAKTSDEKDMLALQVKSSHKAHAERMAQTTWCRPKIPHISTVSGKNLTSKRMWIATHFNKQTQGPPCSNQSIDVARSLGGNLFLEMGFHRQGLSDWNKAAELFAFLYSSGADINWDAIHRPLGFRKMDLPTYRFQRSRYWLPVQRKAPEAFPSEIMQRIDACEGKEICLQIQQEDDIAQLDSDIVRRVVNKIIDEHQAEKEHSSSDRLYTLTWLPSAQAHGNGDTMEPAKNWLIFSDAAGMGESLKEHILSRGAQVTMVSPGTDFSSKDGDRFILNPASADDYQRLLNVCQAGEPGLLEVVHLWCLGAESDEILDKDLHRLHDRGVIGLLHLVQAMQQRQPHMNMRLTLITQGLQRTGSETYPIRLAHWPLWSLGRTISMEFSQLGCRRIDLDMADTDIALLYQEIVKWDEEPELVYRKGQRLIPRLIPYQQRTSRTPIQMRSDGAYLITGGHGVIGLYIARWLAEHKAGCVVLMNRNKVSDRTACHEIERIESVGTQVISVQGDVSKKNDVVQVLNRIKRSDYTLKGIFHAAGVLDDGTLAQQSRDRFFRVMAPKVAGAWNLHRCSISETIDHFVCFSSLASISGSPGQGNYVAANGFLDGLCHYRRQQGLAGLSINWGPWAGRGMARSIDFEKRYGISRLEPDRAVKLIEPAISGGLEQVCICDFNLAASNGQKTKTIVPKMFSQIIDQGSKVSSNNQESFHHVLEAAHKNQRRDLLVSHLRATLAEGLGVGNEVTIDSKEPFLDLGLDSIVAIDLTDRINASLRLSLSPTLIFNHPTLDSLADYIQEQLADIFPRETTIATAQAIPELPNQWADENVAIIGMGCRFPGKADSPKNFWQMLRSGSDAVGPIPTNRWDTEQFFDADPKAPGKMYVQAGGFIDGIEYFDHFLFGISPREARSIDPQHRLLLEVTWQAIENANICMKDLQKRATGVFFGIGNYDHALRLQKITAAIDGYTGIGSNLSAAAGRVSYLMGLTGPSLVVDTACSSSLVAVHLAVRSLQNKDCHIALAGGVNVLLSPEVMVDLCKAKMLSMNGRCRTFDAGADGYVRGEGCGVVVLKRLSDAVNDGDSILAVIRGSAVNQDGAGAGLTVPNGQSQQLLINAAVKRSGVSFDDVRYVEAHGTGTVLGDPIEVEALANTYGKNRPNDNILYLGSVKTNIGHLEAAAGIAGLMKAVLSIANKEIPAHLNFNEPNPHIPWDRIPIRVCKSNIPWESEGRNRIAAVSAFGFTGTNAHIIVEEPPAKTMQKRMPSYDDHVLTISSKSDRSLQEQIRRYGSALEDLDERRFADFCATSNVCRDHFNKRFALVAASKKEAMQLLKKQAFACTPVQGQSEQLAFLFPATIPVSRKTIKQLYETHSQFRTIVDACNMEAEAHLGIALVQNLIDDGNMGHDQDSLWVMIVQYALARIWAAWVGKPVFLVSAGAGTCAAMCFAGVCRIEDALKLVYHRSLIFQDAMKEGSLFQIGNRQRERFSEIVETDFETPAYRIVTANTDCSDPNEPMDKAYWMEQILNPSPTIAAVSRFTAIQSCATIVLGADDWTDNSELVPLTSVRDPWVYSYSRENSFSRQLLECVAKLYIHGWMINWRQVNQDRCWQKTPLPNMYFERTRLWHESNDACHLSLTQSRIGDATKDKTPVQSSRLIYSVDMKEKALARTDDSESLLAEACSVNWVILSTGEGPGNSLAKVLAQYGVKCVVALPGEAFAEIADRRFAIHPRRKEDFQKLIEIARDDPSKETIIVHLWCCTPRVPGDFEINMPEENQNLGSVSLLSLANALDDKKHSKIRLWVVTVNAGYGAEAKSLQSLNSSTLWGSGRSLGLEITRFWGGIIDISDTVSENTYRKILKEILSSADERYVAFRNGKRYVERLVAEDYERFQKIDLNPDASYLITGGTGALGAAVARWMVSRGARHLVLCSRRGSASAQAKALLDQLKHKDVRCSVWKGDVSRKSQIQSILQKMNKTMPQLKGVVHAAGISGFSTLKDLTPEDVEKVFRPKVQGAWTLHRASEKLDLDFFVLFSSIASVWGGKGQCHYAAANRFLDALAQFRHNQGLPALSISWGPWAGGGMMDKGTIDEMVSIGIEALPPDACLAAMEHLMASKAVHKVVAKVDWQVFGPRYRTYPGSFLLEDLAQDHEKRTRVKSINNEPSLFDSHTLSESEIKDQLRDFVIKELCAVIGESVTASQRIIASKGFFELGLNSLMAVELQNSLERRLCMTLPATLAFDYPTVDALVDYLLKMIVPQYSDAAQPEDASHHTAANVVATKVNDEKLAVIGMACRFPMAKSVEAFWELLVQGQSGIQEIPRSRWDIDDYYSPRRNMPGKMYTRYGGFLEDIDLFDAQAFGISDIEAIYMDPQQRILLEVTQEAINRSGLITSDKGMKSTAVFIGVSSNDYALLMRQNGSFTDMTPHYVTGNSLNAAAGRIAFTFGFEGPCSTVDTACSSSLFSVHLACQNLRNQKCDFAVAGGVNLMLAPESTIAACSADMLSTQDKCMTFDNDADGYVRSEGCGVVILRRLSDALRDRNPILAVIRGTAVNQNGTSAGLTVPNGSAQRALIRQALADGKILPNEVTYVETHGTGTPLGDPIEVMALADVYRDKKDVHHRLMIGSVKTNIGHAEAAAGIAGLIKTVLSLYHGKIPPHLHLRTPNQKIPWDSLPIIIPTNVSPWPINGQNRLAGVSSFGFVGTNVHVLVENPPDESGKPIPQIDGLLLRRKRFWFSDQQIPKAFGKHKSGKKRKDQTPNEALAPDVEHRQHRLGAMLYEVSWDRIDPSDQTTDGQKENHEGVWVIFSDHQGWGRTLSESLCRRKARCIQVIAGNSFEMNLSQGRVTVNPRKKIDYVHLFSQILREKYHLHEIVHLWSMDNACFDGLSAKSFNKAQIIGCYSLLLMFQALRRVFADRPPAITVGTQRCVNVTSRSDPIQAFNGTLYGLANAIQIEHPQSVLRTIDLPLYAQKNDFSAFNDLVLYGEKDSRQAVRDGRAYVGRLRRCKGLPWEDDQAQGTVVDEHATYLITGGAGGLGTQVAKWLSDKGAKSIVLAGRASQSSPNAQKMIDALAASGVTARYVSVDVGKKAQVIRLFKEIHLTMAPLRGIIHAAGILDDGVIEEQSIVRFKSVMQGKAIGAVNLHQAGLNMPLDFFVMFSSISSLWGSYGQTGYAAANGFLDSLSHYRHSLGLPSISINWGPWGEAGMARSIDESGDYYRRHGLEPLVTQDALNILEQLLKTQKTQVAAVDVDWKSMAVFKGTSSGSFWSDYLIETSLPAKVDLVALKHNAAGADPGVYQKQIIEYLKFIVSAILDKVPTDIDETIPMTAMGIDSLSSIGIRNRVFSDLELDVEVQELISGASIAELAASLHMKMSNLSPDLNAPFNADQIGELLMQTENMTEKEIDALLKQITK